MAGVFGFFTFLGVLIPPSIASITIFWCAVIAVSQAFKDSPVKHYAAVVVAMVPSSLISYILKLREPLRLVVLMLQTQVNGLLGFEKEITNKILEHGVMWNGVPAVKSGSIIVGILLASLWYSL